MEALKRFPSLLILAGFLGYLAYNLYEFEYSESGEIQKLQGQVKQADTEIEGMRKKKKEGEAFLKSLDAKKEEIREQARKLSGYQGALSEAADIPNLIKILLTEARKLEIRVEKMEPGKKTQKEYYLEQEFRLDVKGSFQQILMFMHRISQLQRILRVGNFNLKKSLISLSSRAVTLDASIAVNAYQYTVSKEDSLSKEPEGKGGVKK
ncbi:MAG: type 4a pilus biogenesis protein PilO [Bdellovibrionales bacterium]|nr:type 4a pilus biogenesis protein PilO [Bdellovibrionales bacterium]